MTTSAPVDLGDPDQAARSVNDAAAFGRIDVVYNNAAGPRFVPFSEMSLDDWDHTIRNEHALVFHTCARPRGRTLVAAGGGSIVNTSSYTAVDGQPAGSTAHAAARGA